MQPAKETAPESPAVHGRAGPRMGVVGHGWYDPGMAHPVLKPAAERFTVEEYLRREEAAEEKHEYHDGEILVMSGGTYRHSRAITNVLTVASNRLAGSPCFALDSNMRVAVLTVNRWFYPDATIVCGEPEFDPTDRGQTTIVNPRVVIEVLSESTEAYDRGAKFAAYRRLESLREYVLVSQDRPEVETFLRRDDGAWLISVWAGLDAIARLRSVEVDLPLAEAYAGLTFEAGPPSLDRDEIADQP